jgi:hypothetical protein
MKRLCGSLAFIDILPFSCLVYAQEFQSTPSAQALIDRQALVSRHNVA